MQALNILEGLNDEQKEAVTYNDGPLLVVAGAGTGKTLVIVRKIAYLIEQKLAKSSEILALTFTKKTAAEMEERVDIALPYGYTDVAIHTFHSFAEEFLRENAYFLGLSTNFKILTEPQQILFIKDRLFDFELKHLRPLSNPTYFIRDMLKLFSRAKDELITPQRYMQYAEELVTAAEKSTDHADKEEAQIQRELAYAYQKYQELMMQADRMDFGDLVTRTIQALKEKPSLLKKIRERYKYIVVDEFQDTNLAQNELLKTLTLVNSKPQTLNTKRTQNSKLKTQNDELPDYPITQLPQITVVGDDDQSIYKFRGAAVSNIIDFKEKWQGAKQVVLTKNYRSTQEILDMSYRVIQNNNPDRLEAKYTIDKHLIASSEGEGVRPELLHFDTQANEAHAIAEKIAAIKEEGNVWSDIAVLVRSNNQAQSFIDALVQHKIPYVFSGEEGLFRKSVIKDIIAFLNVLTNPTDNLALFSILVSDIARIDFDVLSIALHKVRSRNIPLEQYLRTEEMRQKIGDEVADRIDRMLALLDELRRESVQKGVGEIVYRFLDQTGYLKRLSTQEKEGSIHDGEKIISIGSFFDRIIGFQELQLDNSPQRFMEYLEILLEMGDDVRDDHDDTTYDAVRVMTLHKAKGLQFPYVFIVGLIDTRIPGSNRSDTFVLPDALIRETLPEGDAHVQEERRLFYVGMTRARQALFLSAARDYGGKRSTKLSRFVVEAVGEENITQEMIKPSTLERIAHFAPSSHSEPLYSTRLKLKGDKLRLSRAEVDDYITCPRKYKYIHITPIKLMTDPRIVFGRAVHKVLEEYYRAQLAGSSLELDQLLMIYRDNWESEGFLSPEHERLRFNEGIAIIKKFVSEYAQMFRVVEVEKKFRFEVDDVIIEGRIDIVEKDEDGLVRIVDFKTSSVDTKEKADQRAKGSTQLAVYALALQTIDGQLPHEVGLFFLESGMLGTTHPDQKMIEKTKEEIKTAASGIRAQAFTATPDKIKCSQCPFSRYCDDSVA